MTPLHQQERSLSKAGRAALLAAVQVDGGWRLPTYYPARKSNGRLHRVSIFTRDSLAREGLVRSYPPDLLPLGLALRTHILTEEQQP